MNLQNNENNLSSENESKKLFLVVINYEEQYSIWPKYKKIPHGWKPIGGPRTKEQCLSYIEKVWVDMRPLSLRLKMEGLKKSK